jgi:ATP-dependent exoDNAse (exonuclease V) alpha subunit/DNA-binding MarR family transcriptional regulator
MTQKEALKVLKLGKNVFLTGPAGSGKTYVLNEYIKFLKDHGVTVAVTASTGIAATHLKGMTIHSWAGIGIRESLSDFELDLLEQKQYLWKRFEKTKVLIIDEISMLKDSTLDTIDQVAKLFKRNDLPFGGMQVIFSGDFFQLPPIEKKRRFVEDNIIRIDDEDFSDAPFAFKARSWNNANLHICYLSEQFRQEDNNLLDLLNEIRSGELSSKSMNLLSSRIIDNEVDDVTKLFTHNTNVDDFNNKKLEQLKEKPKTYKMTQKGKGNMVEALKRGCLVPENLIIKKGALVMFVKNNPISGYVNGTVGEVVGFDGGYPIVKDKFNNKYIATPQNWAIEEGSKILAEVTQVPLKLAWAVTIHKSQGMTLDGAVIDLSNSFIEGQGYVALSRIKTLEGLFLKGFNHMALQIHGEVKRIDKEFKQISNKIFESVKKLKDEDFQRHHENFLDRIGAKKFKVTKDSGEKLSTYIITLNMIKDEKNLEEIMEDRGIKTGTILTHIEKLLKEGLLSKRDIEYLKPETDNFYTMLDEVREEADKMEEFRLTPIFKALKGQYSFDDIRFAKIFI